MNSVLSLKLAAAQSVAMVAFLALAPISAHAADATPVIHSNKLAIDKHGIKVWTFKTAGNPAFNYKAMTTVHSTVSTIASLILSPDEAPKWAPYVHRIDVISPPDATGQTVFRMELDLPFPLQDRDVVIKAQVSQNADGSVTLNSEAIHDARAPTREGIVRVTNYKGGWSLRPAGNGQVEVTTTGYADLGGAIPVAFANMFVQQQPYQMLQKMRQHLEHFAIRKATDKTMVASR